MRSGYLLTEPRMLALGGPWSLRCQLSRSAPQSIAPDGRSCPPVRGALGETAEVRPSEARRLVPGFIPVAGLQPGVPLRQGRSMVGSTPPPFERDGYPSTRTVIRPAERGSTATRVPCEVQCAAGVSPVRVYWEGSEEPALPVLVFRVRGKEVLAAARADDHFGRSLRSLVSRARRPSRG